MNRLIAPSILSADFLNLGDDIRLLNTCADIIHLDVMDGSQVPNISFGFPVISRVASIASIPMDAHLMVVHPERWFEKCSSLGIQMLSFHLEASGDMTEEFIDRIHSLGMKAGVAINPDVPVESLFPFVGKADFLLVMSVFAGFGGQKFIEDSIGRIRSLKKYIDSRSENTLIEVDGGVGTSNIELLSDAGASIFVAGSSVFNAPDKADAVRALRGE